MKVNFLAARKPLVKQFALILDKIESQPYPEVSLFTSYEVVVNTIDDFYAELSLYAGVGHCLLKGELDRHLVNEPRAKHTNFITPTSYILFDLDGIADFTPEQFMARIGLGDISYVVQYSASAGVKPEKGLSCHIFVLLDRPIVPSILKAWIITLNLDYFKSDIILNRLKESLHWPIDITTCQNDKLIYIAPPICTPKSIDTFSSPRIQLIKKDKPFYTFPTQVNYSTSHIVDSLINELRTKEGLPKSKKLKIEKGTQLLYSPNPKPAEVTGEKIDEEFTYLNLNGGDSWGYYFLTKRPFFLYNFKEEPLYKLQEILPDYWRKLQEAHHAPTHTILALRDHKTDTYYNGWYDNTADTTTLYPTSSKDKLHDFLSFHGIPKPEKISDWTCLYDPCSQHPQRVDIPNLTLNWFIPSEYMRREAPAAPVVNPPFHIAFLIENVIGEDPHLKEHFYNWLACVYRYRLPTGTAWILQGVPGTGKGMLVHLVLEPLLGSSNVAYKRMSELFEKFNEFIERSLICFIDEISIGEDRRHDTIMADLKQQITEPVITIRRMHTAAYQAKNHANWIFSTNNKRPIRIEEGDRRYNVGEFCGIPLNQWHKDTFKFAKQIADELQDFHDYLMTRPADKQKAGMIIENEARKQIIESAMVTSDVVSKAIRSGNLEQLYEWIDDPTKITDLARFNAMRDYNDLIKDLILTRRDSLQREDLYTIFAATAGKVPRESAKLGQYLKHHEITLKPIKRNGEVFRGLHVDWIVGKEWLKDVQAKLSLGKVAPIPTTSAKKDPKDGQA